MPGKKDSLAQARANHDDSPAALDMFERGLSRYEGTTDVDRKHAVKIGKRRLFDFHRNGRAGVVHQHV